MQLPALENKKFIIEYLYINNHLTEQSAVPIQIIHPASKLHSPFFNAALAALLDEKKVKQHDLALYLTSTGQTWYEELNNNNMSPYERKDISWQKWAVILAAIGILATILLALR